MRALGLLLAGGLGLLAAACGDGKSKVEKHPVTPVSKYGELLPGRWQGVDKDKYIQGYEFASDGTLKMTVKGMAEPVPGTFTLSDDRELRLERQATEGVKKSY